MIALVVAALLAASPEPQPPQTSPPPPQDSTARTPEQKKLEEEIARELGASPASPAQPPRTAPPSGGGTTQTGGNPMARLLLLPDISAIGSFAAAYDTYDAATLSPRDGATSAAHKVTPVFQEAELALQSVVDPYARADVFISFTPDGVEVEEAYLTTLALPAGFQVRAGTLKSPFGRLNQQHSHVWDFADAPLAMNRLIADESLSGPGADVSWLAPVPWFLELHLAGQAVVPAGDPAGGADRRRAVVARVLQYVDVGETSALGVGLSAAHTEGAPGAEDLQLGGADVFLKLRPAASRAYLALQGEVFARRLASMSLSDASVGGYGQAVWRENPFWGFGARYDNAPSADPGAGPGREQRWSVLASWFPSEFQRLRLQLAYDRRPGGRDGLEALLHLEFAIGAHGAHPF